MSLTDDPENPKPAKKLTKSVDALAALREAMEQRLKAKGQPESSPPPQPEPQPAPAAAAPKTKTSSAPKEKPAASEATAEAEAQTRDPAEWSRILFHISERSRKLVGDYIERNKEGALHPPPFDPAHVSEALTELTKRLVSDPQRFVDAQIALWQGYVSIWQTAFARMRGENASETASTPPTDKRFQDKEWQSNWLFDMLKQFYLLTATQMKDMVAAETKKLDPKLARKLDFMTRQTVDAMSPSNFWITNPEVLRTVYSTGGENLIKGFENLLTDLENGKGDLRIRMTDTKAFHLGGNIATTPGQVIYENRLIQLIQYAPTTPDVYRVPLLILPPWINKYYILDLREKNSFIAYLVAQGFTVFCVSWVNPDARHAEIGFDDYMTDGALAAMRETMRATGEKDINVVGYCIGGTLLSATLAYLSALPKLLADIPTVRSATYLATMTDFSEPGELGTFIDEDLIKIAEEKMAKQGYLDAATMSSVFNLLRSNDLIWSYVVNNYLLGKDPTPFDILYWNSDSTNMPAAMQRFYIRQMYVENNLVKPDGLTLKNVAIDLRKIKVPSFLISTRDDHIAPWTSTYAATRLYQGPVTFMLAGSGHIAGIINSPAANKYGYWTNDKCPPSAEDWLAGAAQHKGSWWPEWMKWLEPYAGDHVPARIPAKGVEAAPGSYARVRAV